MVTALLSNDTTAVMLTPAVLATARAVRVPPLASLYACAFVANAASFILPISNPANLVVFDGHLPTLRPWLSGFGLPSIAALVATFAILALIFRADLAIRYQPSVGLPDMTRGGAAATAMLAVSAIALVVAASIGVNVGYTALVAAIVSVAIVAMRDGAVVAYVIRNSAWKIVALVAVLFVVVTELDEHGAIGAVRGFFSSMAASGLAGGWGIGAATTVASAAINNLPVALVGATALHGLTLQPWVERALLVSVDVGPNLALTGSLATLIWIGHLHRAGIRIRWWEFLRVGAAVTAPSLLLALLLLRP